MPGVWSADVVNMESCSKSVGSASSRPGFGAGQNPLLDTNQDTRQSRD
jgi:hypothetical protein